MIIRTPSLILFDNIRSNHSRPQGGVYSLIRLLSAEEEEAPPTQDGELEVLVHAVFVDKLFKAVLRVNSGITASAVMSRLIVKNLPNGVSKQPARI